MTFNTAMSGEWVGVRNGGFEQLGAKDIPTGWYTVGSFAAGEVATDAPRTGERCGRITGNGKQKAWRQTVSDVSQRVYTASGWFRAKGVQLSKATGDFARFYFHILYRDRPYSDTTHVYRDLPQGDYDWRRFAVRLVPRTDLDIEKIWVTVAVKLTEGVLDFDDLELGPTPARGGFTAMEWSQASKGVILPDMGQAVPRSALTSRAKHGKWKLIPYEAGKIKGAMVWASDETNAPELTLPLNAGGWHAVYLGLASPSSVARQVLIRLSRDPAFVVRYRTGGQIEEVFFKVADLTGQSLHLAQQCDCVARATGLAYVKLVALTEPEVSAVRAERANLDHRRLVTTIDGFSFIYGRRPTSRRALLQEVEAYRHSDFGTLMLQMGGADMVNYPSKVGQMVGQDLDDFPRTGDRRYAEALRELAKKGVNPTKTLIEGAHDVGMKAHVCIRPGAWVHTEPMADFFTSRFYLDHPEWRCIDRDGNEAVRMSLAVPQVRAHLVEVLREAVSFGADGAGVLFVRGVPYVLFEKPFCDLFQQEHGTDPKQLKDDDQRIRDLRCDVLAAFLQEIRQMLDEEAGRRGGDRLALSAFVLCNEADNLRFGIDVRRWAKEGLVDLVCPMRAGGSRATKPHMRFFQEACQPHGVQVKPTFLAWNMPDLDVLMQESVRLYDTGSDGLTFWDANSVAGRTPHWSVLSRLGHVDELAARAAEGPPQAVTARFHRVGDFVVDGSCHPNWGY